MRPSDRLAPGGEQHARCQAVRHQNGVDTGIDRPGAERQSGASEAAHAQFRFPAGHAAPAVNIGQRSRRGAAEAKIIIGDVEQREGQLLHAAVDPRRGTAKLPAQLQRSASIADGHRRQPPPVSAAGQQSRACQPDRTLVHRPARRHANAVRLYLCFTLYIEEAAALSRQAGLNCAKAAFQIRVGRQSADQDAPDTQSSGLHDGVYRRSCRIQQHCRVQLAAPNGDRRRPIEACIRGVELQNELLDGIDRRETDAALHGPGNIELPLKPACDRAQITAGDNAGHCQLCNAHDRLSTAWQQDLARPRKWTKRRSTLGGELIARAIGHEMNAHVRHAQGV